MQWSFGLSANHDGASGTSSPAPDARMQQATVNLLADMRGKGVNVAEPTDPMHDDDFIRALIATYTIAPQTDWIAAPAA